MSRDSASGSGKNDHWTTSTRKEFYDYYVEHSNAESTRQRFRSTFSALVSKHIVMHPRGPLYSTMRIFTLEVSRTAVWGMRLVHVVNISMGNQDKNDAGRCCVSIHEGIGSKIRNR